MEFKIFYLCLCFRLFVFSILEDLIEWVKINFLKYVNFEENFKDKLFFNF